MGGWSPSPATTRPIGAIRTPPSHTSTTSELGSTRGRPRVVPDGLLTGCGGVGSVRVGAIDPTLGRGPGPGSPVARGHRDAGTLADGGGQMAQQTTGIDPRGRAERDRVCGMPCGQGWWVHLRRCAQCGHIGCCDSSPGQHATHHFEQTGHRWSAASSRGRTGSGTTRQARASRSAAGRALRPPGRPAHPRSGGCGAGRLAAAHPLGQRPRPARTAGQAGRPSGSTLR